MTYTLYIGDRTFSSWSLRGWLLFEKFGVPFETKLLGLYSGTLQDELAALAPARTVPTATTPEGYVLTDSLAIAETLAEAHPDAGFWPADPAARALARSVSAEMHSGFMALRSACPMNLEHAWVGFEPDDAVKKDVDRLDYLWTLARERHGAKGPWLFGEYTVADVMFAPAAARIAGYGLKVGSVAADYVAAHLNDPAFKAWREEGLRVTYDPHPYALPLETRAWPA